MHSYRRWILSQAKIVFMAGTNTHWPYSAGVCPEDDLKQPCQWINSKMYLRSWATLYQSFHVLGSYLLYPLAQAGSSCITFPSYWHKNVLPEPLSISNLSVLLVFSFSLSCSANLHKKTQWILHFFLIFQRGCCWWRQPECRPLTSKHELFRIPIRWEYIISPLAIWRWFCATVFDLIQLPHIRRQP